MSTRVWPAGTVGDVHPRDATTVFGARRTVVVVVDAIDVVATDVGAEVLLEHDESVSASAPIARVKSRRRPLCTP